MGPSPNEVADLGIIIRDLTTSRYLIISTYCLLFYDLLLTFSTEVSVMWTTPWTLGKTMYFLNRYPIFIGVVTWTSYFFDFYAHDSFCGDISRSAPWMYILLIVPAQVIVMLRTIAVWNNNRTVRASLILVFGVYIIAALVVNSLFVHAETLTSVKPIMGCLSEFQSGSHTWTIPAWAFQFIYDGLVFFLVVFKSHGELGRSRVMKLILRDGCLYYFSVLATSIVNLTFFAALPTSRIGLLIASPSVQLVCMNIMANHVMLNMKDASSGGYQLELWERRN